jgi:hypothetical protein
MRRDSGIHRSDFSRSRSNLFFAEGLDTNSRTPPVGQITFVKECAKPLVLLRENISSAASQHPHPGGADIAPCPDHRLCPLRQPQANYLMERTQLFDLTGELKLYGMKAAFDEIMATAIKRQHEPQRVVGEWPSVFGDAK